MKEPRSALSPSALTAFQTPPHGAQDSARVVFASLSYQVPFGLASCPRRYHGGARVSAAAPPSGSLAPSLARSQVLAL